MIINALKAIDNACKTAGTIPAFKLITLEDGSAPMSEVLVHAISPDKPHPSDEPDIVLTVNGHQTVFEDASQILKQYGYESQWEKV